MTMPAAAAASVRAPVLHWQPELPPPLLLLLLPRKVGLHPSPLATACGNCPPEAVPYICFAAIAAAPDASSHRWSTLRPPLDASL